MTFYFLFLIFVVEGELYSWYLFHFSESLLPSTAKCGLIVMSLLIEVLGKSEGADHQGDAGILLQLILPIWKYIITFLFEHFK